ncbi:MAG: bifunctional tRNA (5-methylaminomethyl-2-thiouridine)(34)-methyltransferase MnmD/FAD-dependent 5-carboxymethylaminomethyl-2-thiouridine(34) oxidoreductase MnmC [Francisellaceae bacterium]
MTDDLLRWRDDGVPVSGIFNDIYFSMEDGLFESRHVFLAHNNLKNRFEDLETGQHFVIAETGFGTGLNFLATWQLWLSCNKREGRLHFISIEKYPLDCADLTRALACFPELEKLVQRLLAYYPLRYEGQITLSLADDLDLTLIFTDVVKAIKGLVARVDAWYLDGFAPAKNPDMWSDVLFAGMAGLSHRQTTFATFTVAGQVRRGLEAAGFKVEKTKGFGRKKQMIYGHYQGEESGISLPHKTPYFSLPKPSCIPDRVAIIGAGMAGMAVAYALSRYKIAGDIFDKEASLAQAASGNAFGILRPYLNKDQNASETFHTSGFLATRQFIKQHADVTHIECGALELLKTEQEQRYFADLLKRRCLNDDIVQLIGADKASAIAGIAIESPAAYYPTAMAVSPVSYCKALFAAAAGYSRFRAGSEVLEIIPVDNEWQITLLNGQKHRYQAVVIASGSGMKTMPYTRDIPLFPASGQISALTEPVGSQTIIMYKGYLLPNIHGIQITGATYRKNTDTGLEVRAHDHEENLNMLSEMISSVKGITLESGRVSTRCVTSDHLPIIGAMGDFDHFKKQYYKGLSCGYPASRLTDNDYLDGLYVSGGFGSKGLASSLLAAEIVATMIAKAPVYPLSYPLLKQLHPARFWVRDFKRKKS